MRAPSGAKPPTSTRGRQTRWLRCGTVIPLSVLDLSVVRDGGSTGLALDHTTRLAQHAESLSFRRFWVAEHHNMAIGRIGQTRCRCGFILRV